MEKCRKQREEWRKNICITRKFSQGVCEVRKQAFTFNVFGDVENGNAALKNCGISKVIGNLPKITKYFFTLTADSEVAKAEGVRSHSQRLANTSIRNKAACLSAPSIFALHKFQAKAWRGFTIRAKLKFPPWRFYISFFVHLHTHTCMMVSTPTFSNIYFICIQYVATFPFQLHSLSCLSLFFCSSCLPSLQRLQQTEFNSLLALGHFSTFGVKLQGMQICGFQIFHLRTYILGSS